MRSMVVITSVTIGIFAGVYSVALMNGMIAQRLDSSLNDEISEIQLTAKNFRDDNDPKLVIKNSDAVVDTIRSVPGVAAITERTLVTGMANTASKSVGVQIVGINPESEKNVFTLYKKILPGTGDYFGHDSRYNQALIGEDLAKDLNIIRFEIDSSAVARLKAEKVPESILSKLVTLEGVRFDNEKKFLKEMKALFTAKEARKYGEKIRNAAWSFRTGSRMTLTFLDRDNNQVGAVFRLTGLYDIKDNMFEKSMVFVRNKDLVRLTGLEPGSYHKIIVKLDNVDQTQQVLETLTRDFPSLDIMSWKNLQPDIAMMSDIVQQFYAIFMAIILAALAFGIVNTMLMVVLERTRELGMLTAIGMNKKRVFSMIMLESVFLSLLGGIAGMIVGYGTITLTARNGINFSQYAEGFEAMGYSSQIIPQINAGFFIIVTILIIVTGILSSIYPALKALKLNPVEAIRTE